MIGGANPFSASTAGSTYTVEFTTSATGALANGTGTITLADSGGALPASGYDLDAGAHHVTPGVSGSGASVTLTVPASGITIGNSTQVIVTISGVTTPVAGNYTMTASTSSDTTAWRPPTPSAPPPRS